MRRKVIAIVVLILIAIIGYKYLNKPHRDIGKEQPTFVLSSSSIRNDFLSKSIDVEHRYLNKTIEVYGVVTEIVSNAIVMDNVVFCQFIEMLPHDLQISDSLKVKGRCIGYDDLLDQVKLDQCFVIY